MDRDLRQFALLALAVVLVLLLPLEAIGRRVARALDRWHEIAENDATVED